MISKMIGILFEKKEALEKFGTAKKED